MKIEISVKDLIIYGLIIALALTLIFHVVETRRAINTASLFNQMKLVVTQTNRNTQQIAEIIKAMKSDKPMPFPMVIPQQNITKEKKK